MSIPLPYKLAGWEDKSEKTTIRVGNLEIGNGDFQIIAGPCAVESREQVMAIAEYVSSCGVKMFRGGAFKPRTSPYSFQGLGKEGLELLAEARERFGLCIVTEVMNTDMVSLVEEYTDVLQIGTRNMQNFNLLRQAGKSNKPVLLKRGMTATLEELLLAAEYILVEGNPNVILCERGIRTFDTHSRYTLDLNAVPALQQMTPLPVIVDPSHGTGHARRVIPMARAGAAAGADGVIVEVHNQPECALSDGSQSLTLEMFGQMVSEVRRIASVVREGRFAVAAP